MTLASRTSEVRFVQKGPQGNKGAKLRITDWAVGQQCLEGKEGEEWYDVKVYNSKLYLCIKSHTSSTANNPQTSVANNLGYWALATDWQFVATKLLLAEKIKADQIDADGITAKDVNITGTINADDGYFQGTIETAASGKRIVISPETNSFRMIDAQDKELLKIWFSNLEEESYDSSRILMNNYIEGVNRRQTDITPGTISLVDMQNNSLTTLNAKGVTWTNTANMNSITIMPEKIMIFLGSNSYNGRSYTLNMGGAVGTLRFINGILVE